MDKNGGPKIYRVYDKEGRFCLKTSLLPQTKISIYLKKGFTIDLQDNGKLIIEFEERFRRLYWGLIMTLNVKLVSY